MEATAVADDESGGHKVSRLGFLAEETPLKEDEEHKDGSDDDENDVTLTQP